MNAEEGLAAKVVELYTRTGFGRVLKSEIDLAYFHYFLLKNLGRAFLGPGIRYLSIDKAEIYRLSIAAGMTESRFKKLLEEDFLVSRAVPDLRSFLLETVNRLRLTRSLLREGSLHIVVPNPIARKHLEDRVFALGSSVEYGRNREILLLPLYDFLRLVEVSETAETAALIRENVLAKARLHEHNPELDAFFRELEATPPEERVKALIRGLGGKVAGKTADLVLNAIFEALKL